MKKSIFKYFIAFALLMLAIIVLPACKKSFLDIAPQDGSLTTESFWKVKSDYTAAVMATYRVMTNGTSAGEAWINTPNTILNDLLPNEGFVDLPNLFQPSSSLNWWSSFYLMITRANQPIAYIDRGSLTDEDRKAILAEAKFLRGFAYFNLARAFGGVPLILAPKSAADSRDDPRATEPDTWAQVIADLTEAADGLPVMWDPSNVGRATKGAALAYLANAYMYVNDWQKAADAFSAIEGSGQYQLMPTPRQVFSEKNENNAESVFEVQFTQGFENGWSTDGSGGGGASNVHFMGNYSAPAGIGYDLAPGGGYGGWILSANLAASFEAGDRRRFSFVQGSETIYPLILGANETYLGESMTTSYTLPAGKVLTDALCTKFWMGPNQPTIAGGSNEGGGQNVTLMRYADVLLDHAEVLAELGDLATAYDKVNMVRARAGVAALPVADKTSFDQALLTERRHEFFWESNLYFHLSRKRQLAEYLSTNYSKTFLDQWYYWPIPQTELDQNKALTQNQGY